MGILDKTFFKISFKQHENTFWAHIEVILYEIKFSKWIETKNIYKEDKFFGVDFYKYCFGVFVIEYGFGKKKIKKFNILFYKEKVRLKKVILYILGVRLNKLVFIKKENFKGFIKEIKSFDRYMKSPSLVIVVSNGEEERSYTPKEIWKNF